MKKLYRYSTIVFSVLSLSLTSCSDYLDRADDDNITEAQTVRWYSSNTSATVPLRTNVKEPM